MTADILRTPDSRFARLPGFPFAPHYLENLADFEGLRLHYVDEAPTEGTGAPVALCLHGQPTWSYLYRRMIPPLKAAGYRVVAPDLFGFGRSDKPTDSDFYSFDTHRATLWHFIEALDLKRITLVCQDWGGILGLTLPMAMPERFERLIAMNTALTTGDFDIGQGFRDWRAYNRSRPDLQVGKLLGRACPHLHANEAAAYDAPYPDASYKEGVRRFPELVPVNIDDSGATIARSAREWWETEWDGRAVIAVGMRDPVMGAPAMRRLQKIIRGRPPMLELEDAGHFVQEWGERVVAGALSHFGEGPQAG